MQLLKKSNTTPGTRHGISLKKSLLIKSTNPLKFLKLKYYTANGRSRLTGHITAWHRGGGCKKVFTRINLTNHHTKTVVIGVCYSNNRNSFNTLQFDFLTHRFFFTPSISATYPGSLLECQRYVNDLYLGFRTQIKQIPAGSLINNIAFSFKTTSKYIRAAGTSGQLLQCTYKLAKIRLPSGKIYILNPETFVSLGVVANANYCMQVVGKAGTRRLKNRRPIVRGIAMNPVDHPHGGRTNGGRPSVTPWGKPTKGKPTKKK